MAVIAAATSATFTATDRNVGIFASQACNGTVIIRIFLDTPQPVCINIIVNTVNSPAHRMYQEAKFSLIIVCTTRG